MWSLPGSWIRGTKGYKSTFLGGLEKSGKRLYIRLLLLYNINFLECNSIVVLHRMISSFLGDMLKYLGVRCQDVCHLLSNHLRESMLQTQIWQKTKNKDCESMTIYPKTMPFF